MKKYGKSARKRKDPSRLLSQNPCKIRLLEACRKKLLKNQKNFKKGIDNEKALWYNIKRRRENPMMKWEHSSAGRASALQAEGHRFEPYCSHQRLMPPPIGGGAHPFGPVVQLVRTLACHARGRGFESHPGRH